MKDRMFSFAEVVSLMWLAYDEGGDDNTEYERSAFFSAERAQELIEEHDERVAKMQTDREAFIEAKKKEYEDLVSQ